MRQSGFISFWTVALAALLTALMVVLAGCASQPLSYEATTRLPSEQRAQAHRQLIVTIKEAQTSFSSSAGASPRSYGDTSHYQPSAYARRIADEIARDYGLQWVAEWRIDVLAVHCVVFSAPSAEARAQVLERLKHDKRIESVQPMQQFRTALDGARGETGAPTAQAPSVYNDPYFVLQWQVEAIRVPEAQRWSQGRGVRVAVIDTGVDLDHPELLRRVRVARNFVDGDSAAFRHDSHGTAVVGLIAAAVNNGLGIIGVAPAVELLALKACWHEAPRQGAVCNTLTLAEALAFAIDRKAAVINLSLGGPDDPLLRRLVEAAIRRGIIVVGADPGAAAPESLFPLSVPGVIAVADGADSKNSNRHARIAAPGHEVLTLAPSGGFDYLSGASLSSAMVTGIVALLLERRAASGAPLRLGPSEMASLLERTASPGNSLISDHTAAAAKSQSTSSTQATPRVVNACDAVAAVIQAARCASVPSPKPVGSRMAHLASEEAM